MSEFARKHKKLTTAFAAVASVAVVAGIGAGTITLACAVVGPVTLAAVIASPILVGGAVFAGVISGEIARESGKAVYKRIKSSSL